MLLQCRWALTYYAAAPGAPVDAIACLNLFDFGNGLDGLQISRFALIARLSRAGICLLKPVHWLRLSFTLFGAFNKLMDRRDTEFQALWDADPIPPRLVSLRFLSSNMTTAPAIPFERNRTPALVINQCLDEMVSAAVTYRNYECLGGEKDHLEIPFGHWSSQPEL